MESASWQRPLYGFKISQNQAEMPLKSGFSDGLGGHFFLMLTLFLIQSLLFYKLDGMTLLQVVVNFLVVPSIHHQQVLMTTHCISIVSILPIRCILLTPLAMNPMLSIRSMSRLT